MSTIPNFWRLPWTDVRRASVRPFCGLETDDFLQTTAWLDALVGQYPNLFRGRSSNGLVNVDRLAVGEGWRTTVETLAKTLVGIVQTQPVAIVGMFRDGGSLHVDTWVDAAVDPKLLMQVDYAIALAVARSACTCEQCGREGLLYCEGSTRTTLCAEHAVGTPAPVRYGMERVHLVRKLVDGQPGPVGACRYDRVTDTFTDLDPASLNLENPS